MTSSNGPGVGSWADDPTLHPWAVGAGAAGSVPLRGSTGQASPVPQGPSSPLVPPRRDDRDSAPTSATPAHEAGPLLPAPEPNLGAADDHHAGPWPLPPRLEGFGLPPQPRPAEADATYGAVTGGSTHQFAVRVTPRPRWGLRGFLYTATAGHMNLGPSAAELDHLNKLSRVGRHLPGWHTVTVASMKGGVGKTSVAALLGLTLAEHRGDRVVAVDANPDAGTLAERLLGQPVQGSVRDLAARDELRGFGSLNDIAPFLYTASRLQVLASDQDPAMSEAFDRDEYRHVLEILTRFFNVVITDSGTGLMHSALAGALETTRTLVIVGAPTIDGGSRASKTLDWLSAHGFEQLVADAIVVLSCDRWSRSISRADVVGHFASRCRAVVEIPRDPHLAEGGVIALDRLRPRTRDAALALAAHVADAFGGARPPDVGRPRAAHPVLGTDDILAASRGAAQGWRP